MSIAAFAFATSSYAQESRIDANLFQLDEVATQTNISGRGSEFRTEYQIKYGHSPHYFDPRLDMTFTHPIPEVSKAEKNCPDNRWEYRAYLQSGCLDMDAHYVPEILKFVRQKLKDDPDLLLVQYSSITNNAILMFNPEHAGEKEYHHEKLQKLRSTEI